MRTRRRLDCARRIARLLSADLAAQFVVDMDADDLIERCFRPETQFHGSLRLEVARPTGDDLLDRLIGFAADEICHLVTSDPLESRNLFANRAGNAGQCDVAPDT